MTINLIKDSVSSFSGKLLYTLYSPSSLPPIFNMMIYKNGELKLETFITNSEPSSLRYLLYRITSKPPIPGLEDDNIYLDSGFYDYKLYDTKDNLLCEGEIYIKEEDENVFYEK
ncbi:MAG: hypothetical protein KC589_03920 [Nanoarchaeota archaeon]|nr:hypothetical protein [Nanoarchaeota archaeon]